MALTGTDWTDADFDRWYGPWDPWSREQVAELMVGFERPWWFVGGWAIEAFTGLPREHEDVDVSLQSCDAEAFRVHVGERYCLWSNHGGTLRPLSDRSPELLDPASQIWLKRVTWPLLAEPGRDWLRSLLGATEPEDHPWWAVLDALGALGALGAGAGGTDRAPAPSEGA